MASYIGVDSLTFLTIKSRRYVRTLDVNDNPHFGMTSCGCFGYNVVRGNRCWG